MHKWIYTREREREIETRAHAFMQFQIHQLNHIPFFFRSLHSIVSLEPKKWLLLLIKGLIMIVNILSSNSRCVSVCVCACVLQNRVWNELNGNCLLHTMQQYVPYFPNQMIYAVTQWRAQIEDNYSNTKKKENKTDQRQTKQIDWPNR